MKTENTIYEIRLQMWRRGGDFVRKLSVAMGAADQENLAIIVGAFPQIIERYDAFATLEKKEQPELSPSNAKSPDAGATE